MMFEIKDGKILEALGVKNGKASGVRYEKVDGQTFDYTFLLANPNAEGIEGKYLQVTIENAPGRIGRYERVTEEKSEQ